MSEQKYNRFLLVLLLLFVFSTEGYAADLVFLTIRDFEKSGCLEDESGCLKCADSYARSGETKTRQWLLIGAINQQMNDCVARLLRTDIDLDYFSGINDLPTPLEKAVFVNAPQIIKRLIDAGANPEIKGLYGTPPVVISVQKGHCHLIPILFAKGGESNPVVEIKLGKFSPLTLSTVMEKFECTQELVRLGADINQVISGQLDWFNGDTLLIIALKKNHLDYARKLVKKLGADTETRNKEGDTALTAMVKHRRPETVRVLVDELDADITATDYFYKLDSVQLAWRMRNQQIVMLLEDHKRKQTWFYLIYSLYEKASELSTEEAFVFTTSTLALLLISSACFIPCCMKRCLR